MQHVAKNHPKQQHFPRVVILPLGSKEQGCQWGEVTKRNFKQPEDITAGSTAVDCYATGEEESGAMQALTEQGIHLGS